MTLLLLLLQLASASPRQAAFFVSAGDVATFRRLVSVCERESRCQRIGVHARDAHLSRGGWYGQVGLGHLDPECQPISAGETRPGERDGWATRGAWGLSAASHWQYLPPCYPPWLLDIPIVSASIARTKLFECATDSSGWCPTISMHMHADKRIAQRYQQPDTPSDTPSHGVSDALHMEATQ